MFTTKLIGLALHSTPTESLYLKTLMDVYIRKSRLSMEIKVCLGIAASNESMFEKLCELPEYIKINQERVAPDTLVSGTLRRQETSHYHCPPKLTWNLDYAESDVSQLLEKWRKYHSDMISSSDYFQEQFCCNFSQLEELVTEQDYVFSKENRQDYKALTFGERYGLMQRPASVCSKEISKI